MEAKYIEFTGPGVVAVKYEEVSLNELEPMDVVIQNETSIISAGTELARLNGMEKDGGFPCRPGYGSIGRIIAKGEGVTDYNLGARVFYAGKHASVQRFRHGENHQWAYLFPVLEEVDPVAVSVGCMAEIAMTGPNFTNMRLGDTVAVFGLGMVGILAAMMYKIRGARVIGVDPVRERCALARKVGIELTVDAAPGDQVAEVLKLTGGKGAEVTVDAVGHTAVICNCIKATALFGQVILLGSPRAPYQGDLTPAFWDIHINGLEVRGAHMWRYPVRPERGCGMSVAWAFETVFNLIKTGAMDVQGLISHVIKPEEVPAAYHGLQHKTNEYTCVVIDWR